MQENINVYKEKILKDRKIIKLFKKKTSRGHLQNDGTKTNTFNQKFIFWIQKISSRNMSTGIYLPPVSRKACISRPADI